MESPLNVSPVLESLTKLSIKSMMFSHFIQKVPEFITLVFNNQQFKETQPHYHLIWIFILNCCFPVDNNKNNSDTNTTTASATTNENYEENIYLKNFGKFFFN